MKIHKRDGANMAYNPRLYIKCYLVVAARVNVTPYWRLVTCKRCLAKRPKK